MRGTRTSERIMHGGHGIIPAHAGNTVRRCAQRSQRRDHPRACGEHSCLAFRPAPCPGSSPRMRGTPFHRRENPRYRGIIPAHAGNTHTASSQFQRIWDHPRACGEHVLWSRPAISAGGSSPRMRGTPGRSLRWPAIWRIIPAHAGNTNKTVGLTVEPRDHPRACGEHTAIKGGGTTVKGSSPRMRGTLLRG